MPSSYCIRRTLISLAYSIHYRKSLAEGTASSKAPGGEEVSVTCPPPFSPDCGLWMVWFCLKEILFCSQTKRVQTKRIYPKSKKAALQVAMACHTHTKKGYFWPFRFYLLTSFQLTMLGESVRTGVNGRLTEPQNSHCDPFPPPSAKAYSHYLFLSVQFSTQSKSHDSFDFHMTAFWEVEGGNSDRLEQRKWPIMEDELSTVPKREKRKSNEIVACFPKRVPQPPPPSPPTQQIHWSTSWGIWKLPQRQADLDFDRS